MITADARRRFEAMASSAGGDSRALAAGLRRETTGIGLRALSALALHAAASTPERLGVIYDGAAEGWRNAKVTSRPLLQPAAKPAPIPAEFWDGLWDLLETPTGELDSVEVTRRIAGLCGQVDPALHSRLANCPLSFPGAREAIARGDARRISIEALADFPAGSLADVFLRHLGERGFEPEVLDRDALGLDALPPALAYVNARSLQCHDLWHIVAGYETTALHEIGVSAFQMAQYGHHYSAMITAICLMRVAFHAPEASRLILDTVTSAWAHGRETPPLLGVDWDVHWSKPLDTLRAELGVTPYASPHPADVFEQIARAA